jgi:hypothetical protein
VAKYVKNPDGGIHSVPDDFEAPAEWGKKDENWFEVLEDEAKALIGHLFGEPDPAVEAAKDHDNGTDEDGNPVAVPIEVDPTVEIPTAPVQPVNGEAPAPAADPEDDAE